MTVIKGTSHSDHLTGGADNDRLIGGRGADVLDGGSGSDTADYSGSKLSVVVNLTTGTANDGTAVTDTNSGDFVDPDTGHIYRYVDTADLSWSSASKAASKLNLHGAPGYLATVTSKDEWTYIQANVFTHQQDAIFIGGSDSQKEGNWAWVTGPEGDLDNGHGLQFWMGKYDGVVQNGLFAQWQMSAFHEGGTFDTSASDFLNMYSYYLPSFSATIGNTTGVSPSGGGAAGYLVEFNPGSADTLVNVENATGGSSADVLIGSPVANLLSGGAGNDEISGEIGDDSIKGDAGNDIIFGGAGNDILNGGGDADYLYGGKGDDTFVVDNAGDKVIEGKASGSDTVDASISYVIGSQIENLVLTGSHNIDGAGNKLDNTIIGNGAANILLGSSGNDILAGGSGDDVLNGGSGHDMMTGGSGSDTYVVDDAGDVVVELSRGGTDLVQSSIEYTLNSNVENLKLLGKDDLIGTGNELSNIITGNSGDNELYGLAGDDTLIGDGGTDFMTGGKGSDVFVFDNKDFGGATALKGDRVLDFSHSQHDKIDLSAVDAVEGGSDDSFKFIGTQAFSGSAGELRYTVVDSHTNIVGDLDGDRHGDFLIRLDHVDQLTASDFAL